MPTASEIFRDFNTDGVPASGSYDPEKAQLREYFSDLEETISGAAEGLVQAESWTVLNTIAGTRTGQPSTVPDSDTGTHVDPVSGATVPNAGQYRWASAGWTWVSPNDTVAKETTDNLDNLFGDVSITQLITGSFIAAATGIQTANGGWNCTDYIPVFPNSRVLRAGTLIGSTGTVAGIAFYDANKGYLGSTRSGTTAEDILVSDVFTNAAYIRVSNAVVDAANFSLDVLKFVRPDTVEGTLRDWFAEDGVSAGYIGLNGVFNAASAWRTTDYVPCDVGQTFRLTGNGNTGLVSSVSVWDKNGAFLENMGSFNTNNNHPFVISNPLARYVRASASAASNPKFRGVAAADYSGVCAFAPTTGYALKGEALYLYGRGIVPDRSVPIAWSISGANEEVLELVPSAANMVGTVVPAKLVASQRNGIDKLVASFNINVVDPAAIVSPSNHRNVISLGDSLTNGVSNAGIQGAFPNEFCRRLTGVGTSILPAHAPDPLSLTNIHFRGVRGDQPIKHDGRPGWSATDYLTVASKPDPIETTITNAFWNPGTSDFDIDYYLSQNGFDSGSTASGVLADGSNLTVVIELGWNSAYSETPSASAAVLGSMIDKIHAKKANADILILGLNPAPQSMFKTFAGERFVSDVSVFNLAIKQFGQAYRDLAASKPRTEFLQISHLFNPDIAYPTTTVPLGARTGETVTGATDHVHPTEVGYAMMADALYYWFLYKYCRGA